MNPPGQPDLDQLLSNMDELLQNLAVLLRNQQHGGEINELVIQNQRMIIKNLEVIVKNQINIIENQKYIVENQIMLGVILETQLQTLHAVSQSRGETITMDELKQRIHAIREEKTKEFSTKKLNDPTLI
jgi:hypothetical protein